MRSSPFSCRCCLRRCRATPRSASAAQQERTRSKRRSSYARPRRDVRRVTRELQIPLIVDEIQCGCGRSGSWFAFEQHGIVPDVIIASKAMGGLGMPVAVIMFDESLDAWDAGAHTGTFRGNQLAFAA